MKHAWAQTWLLEKNLKASKMLGVLRGWCGVEINGKRKILLLLFL